VHARGCGAGLPVAAAGLLSFPESSVRNDSSLPPPELQHGALHTLPKTCSELDCQFVRCYTRD
jgi:hypothetical protein